MHCDGLMFGGVLRKFSITSQFLCSKMQKSHFEDNKRFECSFFFIEFKIEVVAHLPGRLDKTPNT